jgi:TonB family protein
VTDSACGTCGAPGTHQSVAGGLCPACLLSAALSDSLTADVADDEAADTLPPGTDFGPFLIRLPLGRGGMAAVYEALDTRLERAVALKVLPPEFLRDHTSARRFETEARVIASLEHPNIVPIYASGIESGIPWMSMRLLAGNNLGVLLEQRRLAPLEAVQLLRQVAAALDYAHAHGVVHRDIKPSNILLDGSGAACVADFGLAQMMESGHRLTQTGILTGTPRYMAPEQALGKRVDHRCDIYSLGIVAYEMLSGATPFTSDSPVALLLQHVNDPLPLPAGLSSASRWMDALHKAAAKRPEDRWPTAGMFVDALESSLDSASGGAGVTPRGSFWRLQSRRRTHWAAVVGSIVVAAAASLWLERSRPSLPEPWPPDVSVWRLRFSVADPLLPRAHVQPGAAAALPVTPAGPATPNAPTPAASGLAGAGRVSTATPTGPPKASADHPPQTSAPSVPAPSQPPPEPSSPATPQTPGPPPSLVTVEDPDVLSPSTRTPAVAPPAPPPIDVVIAPRVIREVDPVYPPAAVSAGLEGEVTLAGVIGIDGKVSTIKVVQSPHSLLSEAARKAWLQYEYEPGRRNGVAEPMPHRRPFRFRLDR